MDHFRAGDQEAPNHFRLRVPDSGLRWTVGQGTVFDTFLPVDEHFCISSAKLSQNNEYAREKRGLPI